MNCIIIEDQPPAQRILKKYIEDIHSLNLIGTYSDAIQALEFLKYEPIDLVFLDIHLPKITGFDFLKLIPQPTSVILTTAFPNYALESYEFNVVDYLLKPFSFQRFLKAIARVPSKSNLQIKDSKNQKYYKKEIFIKSGYEHLKITIEDILYIQSDADYTELFTSKKKYLSNEPLRYWLENLNPEQFVRVHKSYIINTSKADKIASNQIYLHDNIIIPLGRTYKENFLKKFVK